MIQVYVCDKCLGTMVTTKGAIGHCPATFRCKVKKSCLGVAQLIPDTEGTPQFEWYRRTDPDRMTPLELEHHLAGGLFLRKL